MDAFIENANKKNIGVLGALGGDGGHAKTRHFSSGIFWTSRTRGKTPSGENVKLMKWPDANRLSLLAPRRIFLDFRL